MTERLFTQAEANEELANLRELLPRVRDARRGLIDTSHRIDGAVAADGGGVEGSDWFRFQQSLKDDVEALAAKGILLRDPETGLVDFPAEREGRRIFLCWRLGEGEVGFYHDERGGFTGRKPL